MLASTVMYDEKKKRVRDIAQRSIDGLSYVIRRLALCARWPHAEAEARGNWNMGISARWADARHCGLHGEPIGDARSALPAVQEEIAETAALSFGRFQLRVGAIDFVQHANPSPSTATP